MLTRSARVVCLDLDRVIDSDGQLDPRAETILRRCDSWTERSPSGRGLHIFTLGNIPRALKGDQIEVYSDARYIAVTGHRWPGTPETLQLCQAYLDYLVRLHDGASPIHRPYTGPSVPPPDDLAGTLLAKLQGWGVPVVGIKPWADGYLIETACPWADEHTTGRGGAAVMIHGSGAFDFVCLHAHCWRRRWRDFRALMGAET